MLNKQFFFTNCNIERVKQVFLKLWTINRFSKSYCFYTPLNNGVHHTKWRDHFPYRLKKLGWAQCRKSSTTTIHYIDSLYVIYDVCAHLGIQVFPYSPWIPLRLVCHCFFVCLSWCRQCRVYVYIIPVWHFNTSQQVVVLLFFFLLFILRPCISFINTRLFFTSPLLPFYLYYSTCPCVSRVYKPTETRSSRV